VKFQYIRNPLSRCPVPLTVELITNPPAMCGCTPKTLRGLMMICRFTNCRPAFSRVGRPSLLRISALGVDYCSSSMIIV